MSWGEAMRESVRRIVSSEEDSFLITNISSGRLVVATNGVTIDKGAGRVSNILLGEDSGRRLEEGMGSGEGAEARWKEDIICKKKYKSV